MPIWERSIEDRIAAAQARWIAQWRAVTGRAVLLLLAISLLAAGCVANPVTREQTNNAEVAVDLLFEHEGVRVYRFTDGGRFHYYAVPRAGVHAESFSTWSEPCGRRCTRTVTDEIQTVASR